MNVISILSANRPITLRDLVKPDLNRHEARAIKNALKRAKKDQDVIRSKAKLITKTAE